MFLYVTLQGTWRVFQCCLALLYELTLNSIRGNAQNRLRFSFSLRVFCTQQLLVTLPLHYYRPHPKDGEGNVFSLSTPGGVPISHNALQHFPECHGPWGRHWGGTLPGPAGGYPAGGTLPGGTLVRYPPSQVSMGGTLSGGYWPGYPPSRVPPIPQQGTPPGQVRTGRYPGRTTEGVLNTRRAVCLLRSRRRTLLFNFIFQINTFFLEQFLF